MNFRLTVEQVLCTAGLREGQVLAGHRGLNRELTKITVAETPDSLDWLEGGELVCTTGYALIGNPQLQSDWIEEMAKKKVAALIIKPGRFFGNLPEHMITLADEHGFPLIKVPLDVVWPVVIEGVMNLILSTQTERLRTSYDIYNRLTQLVLSSRGMSHIIGEISRLAKNPVILEDRFFNPISHSHKRDPRHADCARQRMQQPQREFLKKALKGHRLPENLTVRLELEAGPVNQITAPIIAGKHLFGYLSVLVVDDGAPDAAMIETIIKHGSTVLALELLNDNTRFQINSMEKTGLLSMLTGDKLPPPAELKKRAGLLGIDLEQETSVISIHCVPDIMSYSFERLEKKVAVFDPGAVLFLDRDRIIVFYHPQNTQSMRKLMDESESIANALISQLADEHYACHAGIGSPCAQPEDFRKSYFEAVQFMKKALSEKTPVLYFDYRRVDSIVSLLHDPADLTELAGGSLGQLIDYDRQNNTELIKTLGAYIRHKFNQAQAAKALNIHINTLGYRLIRIQEILDVDLSDFETCTMLYISLRALGY